MLDKSIKYYHILMHRQKGRNIPFYPLPEGYSYKEFAPGDETDWAAIEASVAEFEEEDEALSYFKKEYLPYLPELKRRTIFVVDDKGNKAGTSTGWWSYTGKRRDPWIHWVAVKPQYQGMGLGKAIVAETLRRLIEIEGDRDIYLHTQTWSYKAIGIYLRSGFIITEEDGLGGYKNEYKQALELLKQVLKP